VGQRGMGGDRAYRGLVGAGEALKEGLVWEERARGNGGASNNISTDLPTVMCPGLEGKVSEPKPREGHQGSGGVKFVVADAVRRAGEKYWGGWCINWIGMIGSLIGLMNKIRLEWSWQTVGRAQRRLRVWR